MKKGPAPMDYETERDGYGRAVVALSQLNGDELSLFYADAAAHWGGYDESTHPLVIGEIQRNEAEWIDHLLSHLGDSDQ